MSRLTRELVAKAMLSSVENYVFEIIDSVENEVGVLTEEEQCTLGVWVNKAVGKAAEELETAQ
ncbi:hypothetical protein I7969_002678 [Salmonella enterica]|nr:hypothetical protein [Salmonella enterica]